MRQETKWLTNPPSSKMAQKEEPTWLKEKIKPETVLQILYTQATTNKVAIAAFISKGKHKIEEKQQIHNDTVSQFWTREF